MAASVVFCSTGLVHPSLFAGVKALAAVRSAMLPAVSTAATHGTAAGRRRNPVRHRRGLRGLERALRADSGLVVIYIHRRRDLEHIVDRAEQFVARGGRILALHAATASFRGSERWARLLGGRFAGHGPVGDRLLRRESGAVGARAELPERIELRDEAYRHEISGPIDVWYRWDDGEPAVWTVGGDPPYVAYFAPGHRARVWAQPSVRAVLSAMIAVLTEAGGVS